MHASEAEVLGVNDRTDLSQAEKAFQAVMRDAASGEWLLFREPLEIIETDHIENVGAKLRQVEDAVNERGLHAAGFIAYEAAPAFDAALPAHTPGSFPLLWFGL